MEEGLYSGLVLKRKTVMGYSLGLLSQQAVNAWQVACAIVCGIAWNLALEQCTAGQPAPAHSLCSCSWSVLLLTVCLCSSCPQSMFLLTVCLLERLLSVPVPGLT